MGRRKKRRFMVTWPCCVKRGQVWVNVDGLPYLERVYRDEEEGIPYWIMWVSPRKFMCWGYGFDAEKEFGWASARVKEMRDED